MRNAGRVVSKTMILSHVWDYNFDPQTNIVDVLVSRLREKIDRPFETKLLHTVRGVGYVLADVTYRRASLPTSSRAFGLRLALWYATLFVVGSIAIVFLTYFLTAASLAQRDRQIIHAKLGRVRRRSTRAAACGRSPTPSGPSSAPRRSGCSSASSNRGAEALVLSMPRGLGSGDARDRVGAASVDGTLVRSARAPKRARICWRGSAPRSGS